METIRKFFPYSFKSTALKDLLITILVYILLDFVCGVVIGLLGALPLVGFLFRLVGWVLGIYFFAGIVIAILNFLGVFKG